MEISGTPIPVRRFTCFFSGPVQRLFAGAGLVLLVMSPLRLPAEHFTEGKQVPPETLKLAAGDFVWQPERSPAGPVLIVVSKPEQVAYVYRNGIRIARTSVSTGRPGHPTPTGVFDILEKQKDHVSSIYKGAEMPWMERLTWSGIAMHAGDLPGYPASHGCVRMPMEFAKLLYTVTSKGCTVIIADEHSAPRETVHPGLIFSPTSPPADGAPVPAGTFVWTPEKSPTGPLTILCTSADKQIFIYRNGVEIGRAPFTATVTSMHIYSALDNANPDGRRRWVRVDGAPPASDPDFIELAKTAGIPAEFIASAGAIIEPGTTLVLTNQPVNGQSQSTADFKIMSPGEIKANAQ